MWRGNINLQTASFIITMILLVMFPSVAWASVGEVPSSTNQEALILLNASTENEMRAAITSIEAVGGVVFASFPNQGLFAVLTLAQAEQIRRMPTVRLVSFKAVLPSTAGDDDGAYAATLGWNARLRPIEMNIADASPHQNYPDALIPPDQGLQPLSPSTPGQYQTSEYMLRSVQVDVFLIESNGSIDTNAENWTTGMRDAVVTEITNGVTWWATAATQGGRPTANLSANIVFHTPFNEAATVATGYEPISRPHTDHGLWIGQIMTNLGYTGGYFSAVRYYNHNRRVANGQDWAFTIFVVNSLNDSDGMFTDNYFGYAYLGGPFMVITYDNDNWGIANMEIVTAHETGHIFDALDEYASSNCTDTETSGYLNIANTNCENGTPATENSIMRSAAIQQLAYPNHEASTPVRNMVGWRDTDGDTLYDPGDTIPSVTLTPYTPDPTNNLTPTWSGSVADIPWDSPTHVDTTINFINQVQYRIDSGSWANCVASDGAFDETEENFTCTPSALSGGAHTIQVQARNRANNTSAIASDTLTILAPVSTIVNTTSDSFDVVGQTCGSVLISQLPGTDGKISLREMICASNNTATGAPHTIRFGIGSGVQTIVPTSALPTITRPVTIDGTSQPGFVGAPLIVLDGINAGSSNGLNISAGSTTVKGLVIQRFSGAGIDLYTNAGNIIQGNYIGVEPSGSIAKPNENGITAASGNNTIGGTAASQGNLISGNDGAGISIGGANNQVLGNKIGANAAGNAGLGNGNAGIEIFGDNNIIGGTTAGAGNLISGNGGSGIYIFRNHNNLVQGNKIGTNLSGGAALGNGTSGINVFSSVNTVIGGTVTGAGNLISGNGENGILIEAHQNNGSRVEGNKIGVDVNGAYAIPNALNGVRIFDAPDNTIGGTSAAASNLISGNGLHGALISGKYAKNNLVLGNKIGANAAGSQAIPNLGNGVTILFAPGNQVGGELAGEGNLISGNGKNGVYLSASHNIVMGNQVGTNLAGNQSLPNTQNGVEIYYGSDNTVGGEIAGAGNLISGNHGAGVAILGEAVGQGYDENNRLFGNRIGVNAAGTSALGNRNNGVIVRDAYATFIGSVSQESSNLISGNDGYGIVLINSEGTFLMSRPSGGGGGRGHIIQGNRIGTETGGTYAVGNTYGGILIRNITENTIYGNLVSGNGGPGITVLSSSNWVIHNKIGSDSTGWIAVGNLGEGIGVWGGSSNSIEDNRIVSNQGQGALISGPGAAQNSISNNQIGLAEDATLKARSPSGGGSYKLMGNSLDGVLIADGASHNLVGGADRGNAIAGNGRAGVAVVGNGLGNQVFNNRIFSNTDLGIDLGSDGVTLNDIGDSDSGANGLQNFPILTGAASIGSSTIITGYMPAAPSTSYTLQFFASSACDLLKHGEGSSYLGGITLTSDSEGTLYLNHTLPFNYPTGQFITATATDPDSSTSEFSPCFPQPLFLYAPVIRK